VYDTVSALRRRRAASWRCEPLPCCSCRDPWPCRCHDGPPSDKMIDAGRDAVEHLLSLDLTPIVPVGMLRAMWRAGHHRTVDRLCAATGWELAG
jgi:hypothetical protein